MAHVPEVVSVEVCQFDGPGGPFLFVHAIGELASSGWSAIRLSPRFYGRPPADGLWEFDLEGHQSGGPVLEMALPAFADYIGGKPDWFKGVKVYAAHSIAVSQGEPVTRSTSKPAIPASRRAEGCRLALAQFDDRITMLERNGPACVHMQKLRHSLTLVVEGPDDAPVRRYVAELAAAGLVAPIVSAYACGGGALSAALSTFIASLEDCLGSVFRVRVEDRTDWVEWRT